MEGKITKTPDEKMGGKITKTPDEMMEGKITKTPDEKMESKITKTPDEKMEGKITKTPDEILLELGGCGRYQWRLTILIHLIKTSVCWSVMSMVLMAARPPYWCADNDYHGNMSLYSNESYTDQRTTCTTVNGTKCSNFEYDENLNSLVSEFNLVCDNGYIPSTMMSIQMAGTLFGNIAAGQIADMYGRKPPFYASLTILVVFNFIGFLSTGWLMFLVVRVVIGIGTGCFLTIQYSILSEFTLAKWRAWTIGFPSWPMEQCVLALIAWLLKDWRYIQLTISLVTIPCLASWWFIPESFRWYIAHDRIEDAEKIVKKVAELNNVPMPDMESVAMDDRPEKDTKYTIMHLFKSKYLIRVTLLSTINWMALGLVSYGLSFGISALSGNIYLNFFLFAVTTIPTKAIAMWLSNKIGRRRTSMLCFGTVAIGGYVVAIVQNIDTEYTDSLTNGFAMLANVGVAAAWGPIQTITIELYPTVIRSLGFGSLSTFARLGAVVGPPIVYMSDDIPGLIYIVCGVIATLCVIGLNFLPETMDENLNDKIASKKNKVHSAKIEKNGVV